MIVLALTQQLLAQSFLGGPGQDLANVYATLAHRSVVCSERILNGYGPQRFRISESKEVSVDGTFFTLTHNKAKETPNPFPDSPVKKNMAPEVDSIECSIYPLSFVGITGVSAAKVLKEKTTNPSDLEFLTPSLALYIGGQGSDSVGNLINRGFSRPITYPSFLGLLWYSCALNFCSETDFLNAVAQVVDCKLVTTKEKYNFVPDAEKIRKRFLRTYDMFGTDNGDYFTLKQRVRYHAYQQVTSEQIIESISSKDMYLVLPVSKGSQLEKDCVALREAAIAHIRDDPNPTAKKMFANVKPDGEIKLALGYGFWAVPLVELKDGTSWGIG